MANILARHIATVSKINDDGTIEATIAASEACGSCGAKSVCGSGEMKKFTLVNDKPDRSVGDTITLVITRSMGFFAILLAYLIPVAIIIGSLLIFQQTQTNEIVAGCVTLGILAIYFIILRILRKYIETQITITIE